jgi:hypothetical protein
MLRTRKPPLVIALAIAATACTDLTVTCTNLPCPQGLWVYLPDAGTAGYSITVQADRGRPWVVECTSEAPCDGYIHFPDFTPAPVEITYIDPDTTITREFWPDYEVTYPNGKECGRCEHADVTFRVDEG